MSPVPLIAVSMVHRLASDDPYANLAHEEDLLDRLPPGGSALVLYVNRSCVVLGKHQNPTREVRLAEAFRRGVPVVRRASGGGTVWHDEGNLNWSYLGPRGTYDRAAVTATVVRALAFLDRAVVPGDKGDLFFDGKKVSGAAYLLRNDRVLHHGTLLCRANLDDLKGLLGTTGTLVEWVGVASRPSPVTNLNLDVDSVADALAEAFGAPGYELSNRGDFADAHRARVAARASDLADYRWLWGQTPPFTWEGNTSQGSGRFRVVEGLVESVSPAHGLQGLVGARFFELLFADRV